MSRFAVSLLLLAATLCFCNGLPRVINGRPRGGFLGELPVPPNAELPKGEFFTQYVDHFNDADVRTWQQQYFVNYTYYKHGGPVFLMLGGEGPASPTWAVNGQWITRYAKAYNAVCFLLEHRFYGKSHPTNDTSDANLKYLSSEQSLADAAYFIAFKKKQLNLKTNKWITFGGSYSGSLSAWFRLKYPHLADGAVATSAPVQAILDFKDYLNVTVASMNTGGSDCVSNVQAATDMVIRMVDTPEGRDSLKVQFKLCEIIEVHGQAFANFFATLANNFEGVVQYNKDNRAFEGAVGTNITIDTLCSIMRDQTLGNPLARYVAVNNLLLKTYSQPCLDINYDKMIAELKNTSWSSSAAEGGRQWMYQTCIEFGFYQSSDYPNHPFSHEFPISFFTQQCKDIYGPAFTESLIQQGINRTNAKYGGFGLKVTKVVFPNGSIDQWHALGITQTKTPSAPAIFMQGTAHCANMYPDSPSDIPALKAARNQIEELIGEWVIPE